MPNLTCPDCGDQIIDNICKCISREQVLRELHRRNPFGGYNNPTAWSKVSTEALRKSLYKYQGRPA